MSGTGSAEAERVHDPANPTPGAYFTKLCLCSLKNNNNENVCGSTIHESQKMHTQVYTIGRMDKEVVVSPDNRCVPAENG